MRDWYNIWKRMREAEEDIIMKEEMDWIDDIIEKTYKYYNNRKIVLWGKYYISDVIKERLREKYGIETAFYVDKDNKKIDCKEVFSTSCLCKKSEEYYVVIPIAFYQGVKDEVLRGGIGKS